MRGGFKVLVSGAAMAAVTLTGTFNVAAQQPTNQTPSTPAAEAPAAQEQKKVVFALPQKCMDCDVALVTFLIKADRTADFEFYLNKVKEALSKSEKPERKQQAAGWIVFRSSEPVQGNVAYVMRIDPIVKGAEYDLTSIIAEVFPTEVQEIFPKYRDAFAGRAVAEMKRLMTMQ
jgi:hypothetical protein